MQRPSSALSKANSGLTPTSRTTTTTFGGNLSFNVGVVSGGLNASRTSTTTYGPKSTGPKSIYSERRDSATQL
jgi:hypothetical protein